MQTLVFAVSAGAPALLCIQHLGWSDAAAAGISAASFWTAAGLAWRALAGGTTELRWDGQQWQAEGTPVRLDLMQLGRHYALLRLRSGAGSKRWLAVSAAEAGPAWHALRVALLATPDATDPMQDTAHAAGAGRAGSAGDRQGS